MGIVQKFFQRKNLVYHLTDIGKNKHDTAATENVPKQQILEDLNDFPDSSIREIAERIRMDENRVKSLLNQMVKDQWIEARGHKD